MTDQTWNLRSGRCFSVLKRAFAAARDHLGMRLCHFSVLGNHIHFMIEADDSRALARGMKGLGVRMARSLNRVMGRRGAVYADRYHSRILRTPTEVSRALNYVLSNAEKHKLIKRGPDPYSSSVATAADLIAAPESWLLRAGPKAAAAAAASRNAQHK